MRYKKLVTHVESHASAMSLLESREQRYIKAIIIIIINQCWLITTHLSTLVRKVLWLHDYSESEDAECTYLNFSTQTIKGDTYLNFSTQTIKGGTYLNFCTQTIKGDTYVNFCTQTIKGDTCELLHSNY